MASADHHAANYSNGVTAGTSLVTANPASYNLYDSNSIMDLRMGGLMIQKQGTDATMIFQTQTTTDLATQPFTNNSGPITNTVSMPGVKGFLRVNAQPQLQGCRHLAAPQDSTDLHATYWLPILLDRHRLHPYERPPHHVTWRTMDCGLQQQCHRALR